MSGSGSSYVDHEQDVKKLALDLTEQHGNQYTEQQFRLWARMIVNKQHDDQEQPPNIPLFTGGVKRAPRKESLTDAITGAATAFAKALNTPKKQLVSSSQGISPRSKAQLSSQYFSQLKDIQALWEGGVLTDEEFKEQKQIALQNIRKMNV